MSFLSNLRAIALNMKLEDIIQRHVRLNLIILAPKSSVLSEKYNSYTFRFVSSCAVGRLFCNEGLQIRTHSILG